jgi:hypothetical protein
MTLSGLQALGVLAVALLIFWRYCTAPSSPSEGTAGSQGDAPEVPGLGGDRPERVR